MGAAKTPARGRTNENEDVKSFNMILLPSYTLGTI